MEDLIRQYEDSFFSKEFCENVDRLQGRIHENFIGIDVDGSMRNKEAELAYLSNLNKDIPSEISHFNGEQLNDFLYMARYETHDTKSGNIYARISIWKKVEDTWQLYYHQGTKIMEN